MSTPDNFVNLATLLRSFAHCLKNELGADDVPRLLADTAAQLDAQVSDSAALLLRQALTIVTGARRVSYGTPEDNFACIADLWNAYLARRRSVHACGEQESEPFALTPSDIAAMMALMKLARLAESPAHADSWRDIAGYAACGARASKADLS